MSNAYGWGPFGDIASFLAASIPLKALSVTTSIENYYVKISWAKPDDQSSPITAYDIRIQQSDGIFSQPIG